MENIYIKGTSYMKSIPLVDFNFNTEICEISGESYMEDSLGFYEPIMNWLSDYFKTKKNLTFILKITYWNTSSSKCIMQMLKLIKQFEIEGNNLLIDWYFDQEDTDMYNEIMEFKELSKLPINILTD